MPYQRFINIISVAAVAFCLLQVWLPAYYLTCDGPCHLYNARILHDSWTGAHSAFYEKFYKVSYTTAPNATTTYLLAVLLFVCKGVIAEKVFLSLYVTLLSAGSIKLLRKLNGNSSLWQLAAMPVVFTWLLSKGFYNFSLGVALWPWMVWAWISFVERRKRSQALIFAGISVVTYFTHLLPFLAAAAVCGCLTLSYGLADRSSKKILSGNIAVLAATLAPLALLTLLFTHGEGGLQLQLAPHPYRLLEMQELKYLINVTKGEKLWALAIGLTLSIAAILAFWQSRKDGIHKYDGFMLSLLPIGFVYLFFPEDFMGRAIIIAARVQLVLYLLAICIIAYRLRSEQLKRILAIALLACFCVLSIIRISCRQEAAGAVKRYLSLGEAIPAQSVVMPLELNENGLNEQGAPIADRNSLFHHSAHYLAADKPLIMLDNYEANAGYFPVSWLPGVNPYNHLGRGAGIEGATPSADILQYEQNSGARVEYTIMQGYNPAILMDPGFNDLARQIHKLFREVNANSNGQNILLKRD